MCRVWDTGCFDALGGTGPAYAWHTTGVTNTGVHRSGRTVRGMVEVFNIGVTNIFDIAKVKLIVRYGVLR